VIKSKLEMEFKDVEGKKFGISLEDPKEDLNEMEVKEAMNQVINKNIFATKAGDIVEAVGARLVTTTVEELEI
jgi:hypothetical protein